MSNFERYIYSTIVQIMREWSQDETADTYVVSLGVAFTEEDGRFGSVTLMHNTEYNFEQRTSDAWDADEARWNWAFWLHSPEFICNSHIYGPTFRYLDPATSTLRAEWLLSLGLPSLDAPYSNADKRRAEKEFVILCGRIATNLRASHFVQERFKKSIPIVIYIVNDQNELDDLAYKQTQRANSSEILKGFQYW